MAKKKRLGVSYKKRVQDVNRIYDEYSKIGLCNREIWRRHIYPRWGISERTFYNLLKASSKPSAQVPADLQLYMDFGPSDEQ